MTIDSNVLTRGLVLTGLIFLSIPCEANVVSAVTPSGLLEGSEILLDCCDEIEKPSLIVFSYLPSPCVDPPDVEAEQAPGEWSCTDSAALESSVHIVVRTGNGNNYTTLFDAPVEENESFVADANGLTTNNRYGPRTVIEIWNTSMTTLLQEISFKTSCDEPLSEGDRYGSIIIQGTANNNGSCGSTLEFDWGDALTMYGTLASDNGPHHLIVNDGPILGSIAPDAEADGLADMNGNGDDEQGTADEDAVGNLDFDMGEDANVLISYYNQSLRHYAYLCAWLDLDSDGSFEDETAFCIDSIAPGDSATALFEFGQITGGQSTTYLRVRISTSESAAHSLYGPAPDGEVEDHPVTINANIFPIGLVHFDAVAIQATAQVSWSTTFEVNHDYYEVQRSQDGYRFETIQRLTSQGDSHRERSYQVVDNQPFIGTNYYRLRQVDHDGSSSYSKVVLVTFEREAPEARLYPNPVGQELQIELLSYPSLSTQLDVIDAAGHLVRQVPLEPSGTSRHVHVLDVADLPRGWFAVRITSADQVEVLSFAKL